MKSSSELRRGQIFSYALPAMPIAALGLPFAVHLPPFYIGVMGLSVTVVGLIFMVARLWDVITDPIMGWAADRFQTPWGRRRFWIVLSVPIICLASWKVFMPEQGIDEFYLLSWLFILYIGYTMLVISHLSWGAELSALYHQRSRVQGIREALIIGGMMLTLTIPIMIETMGRGGGDEITYASIAAMGWFIIIFLPLTVWVAARNVSEKKVAIQKIRWRDSIGLIVNNRSLRYVLGVDFLLSFSVGVVAGMFFFLVEDVLKLERGVSNIMLIYYFATGVLFMPLFIQLAKIIGKHKTQICSSIFTLITLPLILYIPEQQKWVVFAAWFLFGVNMGVGAFLLRSMMADVADEDEIKTGNQRTGLFFALLTMTSKMGLAFSIGLVYPLLGAIGFERGGDNLPDILWQVRVIYVAVPFIMNIAVIWIMVFYPLTQEKQEKNRAILSMRDSHNE